MSRNKQDRKPNSKTNGQNGSGNPKDAVDLVEVEPIPTKHGKEPCRRRDSRHSPGYKGPCSGR